MLGECLHFVGVGRSGREVLIKVRGVAGGKMNDDILYTGDQCM